MTPLTEAELDRLVKILGLLSSDQAGERAAAGAMAWRFICERKLTWGGLLRPRSEPPPLPAPSSGWRRIARQCLAFGGLSRWETGFLCRIAAYKQKPSEKQQEILDRIADASGSLLTAPAADAVTVLRRAPGRRATKLITGRPDGSVSVDGYDTGKHFSVEEHPVANIYELRRC